MSAGQLSLDIVVRQYARELVNVLKSCYYHYCELVGGAGRTEAESQLRILSAMPVHTVELAVDR